jgi:hypothetical protein
MGSETTENERVRATVLGQAAWGAHGSSAEHRRYSERINSASRRRCHCGCGVRATHVGCANGVALMSGCELSVRRWVRTGCIGAEPHHG